MIKMKLLRSQEEFSLFVLFLSICMHASRRVDLRLCHGVIL